MTDEDGEYPRTVIGFDEEDAALEWAQITYADREYQSAVEVIVYEKEGGPILSRWQITTEAEPSFYAREVSASTKDAP